jgi:hypothetical protein
MSSVFGSPASLELNDVPAQTDEFDSRFDPEVLFQNVDKTKRAGKNQNEKGKGSFSALPSGGNLTCFHFVLMMAGLDGKLSEEMLRPFGGQPRELQRAFLQDWETRGYIRRVSPVLCNQSGGIDAAVVLTAKFQKEYENHLLLLNVKTKARPVLNFKPE